MLEAMRRGAKSWVAKGLILLLIASFAVWGIGDVFSTRGDSTVASAGDRTVTVDQFADALQRQRGQLSQQAGRAIGYSDMRALGIDRRILDRLIRDAAFGAELDRLGLAAPDAAVAEAIRTNPAFQTADGSFSESRYRLSLGQLGFSPAGFEALTRELLGQQILADATALAGGVAPGVAPRVALYEAERRRVTLLRLPLSAAPSPGQPDAAAIAAHYEANRAAFREPERRWGHVLHVDIAALGETPGEAALRAAYEARRAEFETPASRTIDQLPLPRERADVLAARVDDGDIGFEELARELGEAPGELSLGTVTRGDLPQVVGDAVFAAEEPGILGPVEAPAGPVLIRIRSVSPGGAMPFEAVRDTLAADLARAEAAERALDLGGRIEELRAEGRSLPEIAGQTGLELIPFAGLARDGSLAGGGEAAGVIARAPVIEEIFAALDHEEREILPDGQGGYVTVLVDRIEESRVPPLDAVRERVIADWRRAERLAALEAEAAAVGDGQGLAALADRHGLAVETLDPFTRGAPPSALPPALVERVFAAAEGEVASAPASDGEAVLAARVEEIATPAPERLEALSGQVEAEMTRQMAEDQQALFARAIRASMPVAVNEGAIEDVFSLLGAAHGTGM